MSSEKNERDILLISFGAGVLFAIAEFIFSIFSHSQSALMDAAYDASELIIIVLTLFLTPLFHKPISEKRPYGFFQVESIFLTIKPANKKSSPKVSLTKEKVVGIRQIKWE